MLPLLAMMASAPDASGIVWIHDDFAQAKKTAIAKKQLIAVDVWATWCHTCLSMKNFALKEAPMAAVKDQLTFLALDYDKEKNASFFEKYPAGAIPAFFVIDPKTGSLVARWIGSGTSSELASFFKEAGKPGEDSLQRGQLAAGKGDMEGAANIFEAALKNEKLAPAMKGRIVNGLVEVLYRTDPEGCASSVPQYLDGMDESAQSLDAIAMLPDCAESLDDAKKKNALLADVAKRLEAAMAKNNPLLAVDDSSAYLGTLVSIYDQLGDKAKAESALKRRVALLDAAANAAPTQEARSTFDFHRMEAYLRLQRYDDAIAMLTASEKQQPKDFNHPWRLAQVYLAKGDVDLGLAAVDRALANGYGGRKMRLYSTKLDLLLAKKDYVKAKATVAKGRSEMKRMKQLRESWKNEFESKAKLVEATEQKS